MGGAQVPKVLEHWQALDAAAAARGARCSAPDAQALLSRALARLAAAPSVLPDVGDAHLALAVLHGMEPKARR
jgi:hypothetical protein